MAKASLLHGHFCLLFVAICCFFSNGYGEEEPNVVSSVAMPPHYHSAVAPTPHHNHHHHNHSSHHPPTASPAHAPTHNHHHHHNQTHAPSHAPAHAPTAHAPVHAPTHAPTAHPPASPSPHAPPTHPPTPSYRFPRSLVEVQGVVYCKSCKYAGADTLLGATPVLGATVKLQCNNTKYPLNVVSKTDKNGYFRIKAPKTVTNYGAHKCKIFLVSSPAAASCQKPSSLHGGSTGAVLRAESISTTKPPVGLYTVGPLAFEPNCPHH